MCLCSGRSIPSLYSLVVMMNGILLHFSYYYIIHDIVQFHCFITVYVMPALSFLICVHCTCMYTYKAKSVTLCSQKY